MNPVRIRYSIRRLQRVNTHSIDKFTQTIRFILLINEISTGLGFEKVGAKHALAIEKNSYIDAYIYVLPRCKACRPKARYNVF